jgi:hypothetical protein
MFTFGSIAVFVLWQISGFDELNQIIVFLEKFEDFVPSL